MDSNPKQAKVICEFSRGTFSTLYFVEMANQKYALKVLTTPESQNHYIVFDHDLAVLKRISPGHPNIVQLVEDLPSLQL